MHCVMDINKENKKGKRKKKRESYQLLPRVTRSFTCHKTI